MSEKAIQEIRSYASSEIVLSRFEEILGERSARAYISGVVLAVANSDHLQKCSPQSILSSALQAATLRLSCDPNTKEAYLVPYKGRATLQVGYKGLYTMAVRTGKYRFINVSKIYEGQEVVFDPFTGSASLEGHKKSGNHVGWQGTFVMYDGFGKTVYMSVEEIHEHARKFSKSYSFKDAPWQTNTEAMERKTVLRHLLQTWGYLSPEDRAILDGDEDEMIDAEWIDEDGLTEVETKSAPELISELGFDGPPTPETGTNGNGRFWSVVQSKGFDMDRAAAILNEADGDHGKALELLGDELETE